MLPRPQAQEGSRPMTGATGVGGVSNQVTGGVFFGAVIQSRDIRWCCRLRFTRR